MTSLLPVIDKEETNPNCLWRFITSKNLIKYVLFVLIVILAYGILVVILLNDTDLIRKKLEKTNLVIGNEFTFITDFYPIIGSIGVCIQFFGVFAIIKESATMVKWLCNLLFIAFVLNLLLGATIICATSKATLNADLKFRDLVTEYKTNWDAQITLDAIQRDFTCCGYYKPEDWKIYFKIHYPSNQDYPMPLITYMPDSCCSEGGISFMSQKCVSTFPDGCKERMSLVFSYLRKLILWECGILGIAMLLGAILAARLEKKLKEINDLNKLLKTVANTTITPTENSVLNGTDNPPDDYSKKINEMYDMLNEISTEPISTTTYK